MGQARIEVEIPVDENSYDAPMMFTASTQNRGASPGEGGGSASMQTFEFSWGDSGFTNTNWWGTEIKNGPTEAYTSDENLQMALNNGSVTIDNLFTSWSDDIKEFDVGAGLLIVAGFAGQFESNAPGCVEWV